MSRSGGPAVDSEPAALDDGIRRWTRQELEAEYGGAADVFIARGVHVMATLLDNGAAWVVADGAAARAGVVHVPLPAFFSPQQLDHALRSAGVDALLAPLLYAGGLATALGAPQPGQVEIAGEELGLIRLSAAPVALPARTAKITFTSGTTGTPKGVCLSQAAIQAVADGLVAATRGLGIRRHLCVLPLPVLLENVAGLLAPLARHATCVVPRLGGLGLTGSSSFDPALFHGAVERYQPHSLILLPQMLRAWTGWLGQRGLRAPGSLRLVAVGGAAVGERLLGAARGAGIPAYEGYGLSEGASVQTLNLPGADRPGSAGRPLPHARVRVAPDGEIEVSGSLMAGYLGDTAAPPPWWPTGDLGRIDDDGFVHVHGRKKNVLITSFGRNVSPEWIEQALQAQTAIAHAAVFGEGEPALSAVLWPVASAPSDVQLQAAVDAANAGLPDYARVARWVRARAAFHAESGLATANGRPQRAAIWRAHADALSTTP
ncbi:MAG TPA: AMP-binding protein [Ramlibacter sp.]